MANEESWGNKRWKKDRDGREEVAKKWNERKQNGAPDSYYNTFATGASRVALGASLISETAGWLATITGLVGLAFPPLLVVSAGLAMVSGIAKLVETGLRTGLAVGDGLAALNTEGAEKAYYTTQAKQNAIEALKGVVAIGVGAAGAAAGAAITGGNVGEAAKSAALMGTDVAGDAGAKLSLGADNVADAVSGAASNAIGGGLGMGLGGVTDAVFDAATEDSQPQASAPAVAPAPASVAPTALATADPAATASAGAPVDPAAATYDFAIQGDEAEEVMYNSI